MGSLGDDEIRDAAVARLEDYLSSRKISLPMSRLLTVDLTSLGFGPVDWGILIGEIQCDTMMMFDWDMDARDLRRLPDVIDNLMDVSVSRATDLYQRMVDLWPEDKMMTITVNSLELSWP